MKRTLVVLMVGLIAIVPISPSFAGSGFSADDDPNWKVSWTNITKSQMKNYSTQIFTVTPVAEELLGIQAKYIYQIQVKNDQDSILGVCSTKTFTGPLKARQCKVKWLIPTGLSMYKKEGIYLDVLVGVLLDGEYIENDFQVPYKFKK